MSDIECPYCGHEQEVCHDDGKNYEEDATNQMDCYECEKTFVFSTVISFDYYPYKADCLNGSEHRMKPVKHFPKHHPDWVRCEDCGHNEKGKIDASIFQ